MPHLPTPEQAAIIQAAGHSPASLMISAYAGTAKTTTIEMLSKELKAPSILALAFNVKIKDELTSRLPKSFTVKTMNGLGHGAWASATGKRLTLDTKKIGKLISTEAKAQGYDLSKEQWATTLALVKSARNAGLVPSSFPHKPITPDTPEAWEELVEDIETTPRLLEFARSCLIASVKAGFQGLIDFDDQIYLPVAFGGLFPRFHTIIVDEAQDLSPMNHRMLARCRPERLIVCGDRAQSLYAFRGADTASMEKIRALRPDWIDLPLTLTFRCPKAVVARQQWHVHGYTAAPANAEGRVLDWTLAGADGASPKWELPPGNSVAILCRNNAPLISLAFRLLRRGIPCHMLGRDLGRGLVAALKKLGLPMDTPLAQAVAVLTASHEQEMSLARAADQDAKQEKLTDRYESILAVVEHARDARTLADLISTIEDLFSREAGRVTLATAHRAKGLEWHTVVHLDPWRIPSKWAKTEAELQQEANAQYVIETRAKDTLILANKEDFK